LTNPGAGSGQPTTSDGGLPMTTTSPGKGIFDSESREAREYELEGRA
jgi:hypothetical protein